MSFTYIKKIANEDWSTPLSIVDDNGTDLISNMRVDFPGKIVDFKDTCETGILFERRRSQKIDNQDLETCITHKKSVEECNKYYMVIGGFYIDRAKLYGNIIQVYAENRKNQQEREQAVFCIGYSEFAEANLYRQFTRAGIIQFNPKIRPSDLNKYLREAIRLKLEDGGKIPTKCGFTTWRESTVFVSAEFYKRNDLPPMIKKHFDPQIEQDFNYIGKQFQRCAERHTNPKLFVVLNTIRICAVLTSMLAKAEIRFPKIPFIKGDAYALSKYFQVYNRGINYMIPEKINVPAKQFSNFFVARRDDTVVLRDSPEDSEYKQNLGAENLRSLQEQVAENLLRKKSYTPFLPIIFSERLAQEAKAELTFILDASALSTDCSDNPIIRTQYSLDRKIVAHICAEPTDFVNLMKRLYLKAFVQKSGNTLSENGKKAASTLIGVMQFVIELCPAFLSGLSMEEMQRFVIELMMRSEMSSSGGDCVQEFKITLNHMIQNGEIDLLLHSPLSKAEHSTGNTPPVFLDQNAIYLPEITMDAIVAKTQLNGSATAIRKALYQAGLLRCDNNSLLRQVTLYDIHFAARPNVTHISRDVLTAESIAKCRGGLASFVPCQDTDSTRIPLGNDERGRVVYLSPNHPDLPNKHIEIIGDSGSGKSTAGNLIVRAKHERGENIVYVDYSYSNTKEKMLSHGFDEEFYNHNVREYDMAVYSDTNKLQQILHDASNQHAIPIFRTPAYGDEVEEFLNRVYGVVVSDDSLSITLVIDEVHELNYGKASALCQIMEKGRGNGISLISILQAPHELKPMQLSRLNQSSVKLVFTLNDGDDAEAAMKKIGLKPRYRFVEQVGILPKRSCLVVGYLEDSEGNLKPKQYVKLQIPDVKKENNCTENEKSNSQACE